MVKKARTHSVYVYDDLISLVKFMEEHPNATLNDWVQYETVKHKMKEAADVET